MLVSTKELFLWKVCVGAQLGKFEVITQVLTTSLFEDILKWVSIVQMPKLLVSYILPYIVEPLKDKNSYDLN